MSVVNVNSVDALDGFEKSMARFASETRMVIEAVQHQIQRKKELLDQIVAERQRAVLMWQAAYDDAQDQDDSSVRQKLAEAEEELREARMWQRRVDEVCADYKKHMKKACYLSDEHSEQGRQFLRSQIGHLNQYVSVKTHSSSHSQSAPLGSSETGTVGDTGPGPSASMSETSALTSLPLPKGFGWVVFEDLKPDQMNNLPADIDYRKDEITKSDMQEGLVLLQTQILPAIQQDPQGATRWHFADLDLAVGRFGKNSLSDIHSAYFGDHRIRVSRYEGESHFRIENGLHRIKAALDLGWNAVPAEIIEVSRGHKAGSTS